MSRLRVAIQKSGRLTDQSLEVFPQLGRSAPAAGYDDLTLRINHEFGIGTITQGMLQVVVHRVADPLDPRA